MEIKRDKLIGTINNVSFRPSSRNQKKDSRFRGNDSLKKPMIYLIIILAIITRFIPHMPNFAPITALAIFSGANLGWKKAAGITLAVRFISDVFLGFFSWPLMVAVYVCHLAGVLFGVWIKQPSGVIPSASEGALKLITIDKGLAARMHSFGMTQKKWIKIIASSLGASALFFLVTNFAFFYAGYAHNISGIAPKELKF